MSDWQCAYCKSKGIIAEVIKEGKIFKCTKCGYLTESEWNVSQHHKENY